MNLVRAESKAALAVLVLGGSVAVVGIGLVMPVDLGLAWRVPLAGLAMLGTGLALRAMAREEESVEAREEERERLRHAVKIAGIGIWDWDLRTHRLHYNEACSEMLGYQAGDVESSLSAWGKLVHPADLSRVREALDAHLDGRTPVYEVEVRLRAQDGTWRWIVDRGRVVERDKDGRAVRAVGVHVDVTDRKLSQQAANTSPSASTLPVAGHGAVLVVDDDAAMLVVMESIASRAGYDVRGASSGGAALAALEHDPAVDAIVTDFEMDGMTGVELAKKIRERGFQVPILVTSGQERSRLGDLGPASGYLAKPFGADQFLSSLAGLLNR